MANIIHSAGIILYRKRENSDETEFFMCSPGGPVWYNRECWCFPKGQTVDDENSFETAIREFSEETGCNTLSLNRSQYTYHGSIKQNSSKQVHVYSKKYDGEDLSEPYSNTFLWTDGKEYPEIGKYKWMTYSEIMNSQHTKAYDEIYKDLK